MTRPFGINDMTVYDDGKSKRQAWRTLRAVRNVRRPPYLPASVSLPDRQLQLFQPFHLRHAVPGLRRTTLFIFSQKAASLTRAFSLTVFFILFHLLSRADVVSLYREAAKYAKEIFCFQVLKNPKEFLTSFAHLSAARLSSSKSLAVTRYWLQLIRVRVSLK